MNIRKRTVKILLALGLTLGVQLGVPTADAAPCAGFSDVDDSNTSFCPSVEWIKNRSVTLGCAVGLYCPNDPVTRLQMAAFMKRLGDALSPAVLSLEANSGPINLDLLPTPRICTTQDLNPPPVPPAPPGPPGKPYPRRAFISTTFTGLTGGALQYKTDLQFSTDGGASWDFVWPSYANRDGASSAHWVSSSQSGSVDLDVNLPYRFSMLVSREAGAGTANFTDSRCFVTVSVFSRTGSTSPFDQNPQKAPDADH